MMEMENNTSNKYKWPKMQSNTHQISIIYLMNLWGPTTHPPIYGLVSFALAPPCNYVKIGTKSPQMTVR